jgi:hypothetical protein
MPLIVSGIVGHVSLESDIPSPSVSLSGSFKALQSFWSGLGANGQLSRCGDIQPLAGRFVFVASYVQFGFSKRISHNGLITPSPSISVSHMSGILSLFISQCQIRELTLYGKQKFHHFTVI